jgi:hypothetical protein
MSKAEDEALADSFKYGSGPFTAPVQGYAPLGSDPYGIYPVLEDPTPKKSADTPASKKES